MKCNAIRGGNQLIGFVVLNYCTKDETIQCVNSIELHIDESLYRIVIVDNASPDHSGLELQAVYQDSDIIDVVLNKQNIGFAQGNNVGIDLIESKYDCDFICVMNSDTYLVNNQFYKQIQEDYDEYHFWVLGPNVITPDGELCNPVGDEVLTIKEAKKKTISLYCQLLLNFFNVDNIIRNLLKKTNLPPNKYARESYYTNVKLHGCCLVFSKQFVDKYHGFNPNTFLYLEEDLLYITMMTEKRNTLYSPNVVIYHMEDAATDKIASGRKKRRFIIKNHIRSMKAINKYLQNNQNNPLESER